MATLYTPEGVQAKVKLHKGTSLTLEEAQELIGGYVEVVAVPQKNVVILVNEDGHSLGLALNQQILSKWGLYIVGNAIECKRHEFR